VFLSKNNYPKDWTHAKLGEVIKTFSGGTPKKGNPEFYKGSIPWIRSGDLNQNRVKSVEKRISKIGLKKSSAKMVKPGTLLLAIYGATAGVVAISEIEASINQAVLAITPDDVLDKYFLENWLKLNKDHIVHLYTQGGQPNLSAKTVKNLVIAYPNKAEQQAIVEIFSTWDEAISKTEKLIKAKKRYKKGLMQRLLTGKVRFPEYEGEDWVEVKLKKFFKPFSDKNKDNEDLPILSCSKVHGITLQSNIFDKRVASKDIKRYKVVERDDLIYDPMLLWDASIGFLKEVDRGVISPAYNTFKFKENSGYRPFFEYLFDTHYMRYNYKAISQGTNRRRRKAPAEAFLKIDIRVPNSVEEQKKIATVLGTLSNEIKLLKEEVALYQKQKKGLMQQLLTGKVRVK
jgi:type I restriction enzyme, S subunit